MTPRVLKSKEAAQYLAISLWKLKNLVQSGDLPYLPGESPSAPWRFDVKDLDNYVEKAKVKL